MRCTATRFSIYLLAAFAAGCANEPGQPRGNFDYVKAKQTEGLQVPDSLAKPQMSPEYVIPPTKASEQQPMVGKEMNILPPAQVMPLPDGSTLPLVATKKPELLLEPVHGETKEELYDMLWNSMLAYLNDLDIQTKFADKDQGLIITDWHTVSEDDHFKFFGLRDVKDHKVQEQYALSLSDEGTRVRLSIGMTDYRAYTDNKVVATEPNATIKNNDVVNFMNNLVAQYDTKAKALAKQRRQQVEPTHIELNQGEGGESVIVFNAGFDEVWKDVNQLLPEIGFGINDKDQSVGVFYTKYGANRSFWQRLFGADTEISIPTDKYQVQLGDQGESTSLSIFDDDNKPLTADQMTQVYDVLEKAMEKQKAKQQHDIRS